MRTSVWLRKPFLCKHIAQFSKTGCDCTTLLASNVILVGSAMSLTDLAALFKTAGDSDAVRDGIQAFVEETLIEPEKLGEEEAVAKRAFVQLLNASGGVDVAVKNFHAVHAEINKNHHKALKTLQQIIEQYQQISQTPQTNIKEYSKIFKDPPKVSKR